MTPKYFLRDSSVTALTCIASLGVIATAVSAVNVTQKALLSLEKVEQEKGEELSTWEKVKIAGPSYIPAIAIGAGTVLCIIGANVLTKHSQANLASAYALVDQSYKEYKDKVKELFGEETHQQILDSLAAEKAKDMYVNAGCGGSLYFDERDNEEKRLFFDSFSRRYFQCSLAQLLEAEYHLNRNWTLGMEIGINDFYEFLGLEPIAEFDDLGWFWDDGLMWIDFDHHKTVLDDGLEVCVVDLVYHPRLATDDDY